MPLRFRCKACNIALAGTTFNHLLQAIPDEWKFNLRGAQAGVQTLYLTATPTSTSMIVAASGAAASGDVFCHVEHTFIQ